MTPADLSNILAAELAEIAAERRVAGASIDEAVLSKAPALERPKSREHGDWASNVAMKLAKPFGMAPRELAERLASGLGERDGIAAVDIAGPGFINIRLDAAAAGSLAKSIVDAGASYGHNTSQAGQTINLEFVSANPTGPLHIGHTRWAALGDAIGRVMSASGATVAREFYINDAGAQMDRFARSVLAAATGAPAPEDGYAGSYIGDLAAYVLEECPNLLELPESEQFELTKEIAYRRQLSEIQGSLAQFNVQFDVWFSERQLHAPGPNGRGSLIDEAVDRLRAQGHVFDDGDAVWVRTTEFGDDKDRVIRRSNDEYTYFAADAAYYLSKSDRGFQHKIYLLGADHHGYVHRLKALAGAAGDDPERDIEVLIGQLVSVNGARLSKRAGNIIEMDDLREWIGTDALRYSLARYPPIHP